MIKQLTGVLIGIFLSAILLSVFYIWYRNQQAVWWIDSNNKTETRNTFADDLNMFKSHPPVYCNMEAGGFDGSKKAGFYSAFDAARFEFTYSSGITVHEILNSSGLYLWRDDSEYLYYIDVNTRFDNPAFAAINDPFLT